MSNENKLNVIRGLLAKAESTTFPEEAEGYRAKAAELIGKYDVDERLLGVAQGQDRSAVASKVVRVEQGYRKQQLDLIHRIADALGVYTVQTWSQETKDARRAAAREGRHAQPQRDASALYGTADTIELVELLFTSLLIQVSNDLAKLTIEDVPAVVRYSARSKGGALKAHRVDFYYGWNRTVGARLKEAHGRAVEEAAEEGHVGAELVLVSERERYEAAAKADFKKLSTSSLRYNPLSAAAGGRAGERADIGLTRVGQQHRSLTGS